MSPTDLGSCFLKSGQDEDDPREHSQVRLGTFAVSISHNFHKWFGKYKYVSGYDPYVFIVNKSGMPDTERAIFFRYQHLPELFGPYHRGTDFQYPAVLTRHQAQHLCQFIQNIQYNTVQRHVM